MKTSLIVFLSFFIYGISYSQKPKNGRYTYAIAFNEWGGKSLGATCTVIIKGDSIKVVNDGKSNLSGGKDDIIDAGIILKHKTGKWIIGYNLKDKTRKNWWILRSSDCN